MTGHCAADSGIGSHAGLSLIGDARFVRPRSREIEVSADFFFGGWLRWSSLSLWLVTATGHRWYQLPLGTDCRLIRGRGLRVRRA